MFEPSFGKGAFLVEIVSRLLKFCEEEKILKSETIKILNETIWGIEIDKELFNITINRLNEILNSKGYEICKWDNLLCANALEVEFNK